LLINEISIADPKGANNQLKDKFDSVIRSHQQPEQKPQSEGGDAPSREDFDEDEVSIDEDSASNDNNNSSGGGGGGGVNLDDSEIMN
jgi:hypothetical protein